MAQLGAQNAQAPALTFRAGKMHRTGTTVRADTRKGEILVAGEQSFIHLQWRDRYTGIIEDDLMVFADEAKFFKVEKCTTGRVYILQFQGQGGFPMSQERFFWMQEPSDAKDEEFCRLINQFIKNPATCVPGAADNASTTASSAGGGDAAERMRQMMMSAGNRRPQAGAAGAGARPAGEGAIDIATLQSILGNITGGGGAAAGAGATGSAATPAAGGGGGAERHVDVQLTDLFAQESVRGVLSGDPAGFEQRLSEHFPEGIETSALDEIRSPQFRQSLDLLQVCCFTFMFCE